MFSKQDLKGFPWFIIKSVSMNFPNIRIEFFSGNGLEATSPDMETFLQFKDECIKNISRNKITIEE